MRFFFVSFCLLILNPFLFSNDFLEKKLKDLYLNKNSIELLAALEKTEKTENPLSFFYHGCFWLDGTFGSANAKLANYYFLKSIEFSKKKKNKKMLAIALKNLGDSFYSGDGIDQLTLRALDCYKESAKLGYEPAMFNAAVVYNELNDIKKANYWLKMYCKMKRSDLKEYAKKLLEEWKNKSVECTKS